MRGTWKGAFIAATQLSEAAGTIVRHTQGEVLVTDGPSAESRELFIGFYVVEADSLDEAIALAGRIPISDLGRNGPGATRVEETRLRSRGSRRRGRWVFSSQGPDRSGRATLLRRSRWKRLSVQVRTSS